MAYQHAEPMTAPEPPQPESGERFDPPPWPWWYAPAAVAAVIVGIFVIGGFLAGAGLLAGVDPEKPTPALTIVGLFLQAVLLVATAVLLAWLTARPRAWHFGLRSASPWRAVGYSAAGFAAFLAFGAAYEVVVDPQGEQTLPESLGVNRGVAALVLGGFLVIVVAPVAEELFFRGFFYRALRNGTVGWLGTTGGVLLAAAIDGVVFALPHFDGKDSLVLLPLLGVLGFVFCLVYEYTGTLFTTIALHALNNSVAYIAVANDGAAVAIPLGTAMLAGSVLVPRLLGGGHGARGAPGEAAAGP